MFLSMKFLYILVCFLSVINVNAVENILVINSSGFGDKSVTKNLTFKIKNDILKKYPNAKVVERDLNHDPIPHLSSQTIGGFFTPKDEQDEKTKKALELSNILTHEVLISDIIIIGSPMWNFSIPSVLKAWIDHVVRINLTFKLTGPNKPPVGLLSKNTKVIIAMASGGSYSEPYTKNLNYNSPYLKEIFEFMGAKDIEIIKVEGVSFGEEKKKSEIASAYNKIDKIIKNI